MKELFESLWEIAPRLMSVVIIFISIFYVCLHSSRFYIEIMEMRKRLANMEQRVVILEQRLTRLEEKVDRIIDYLIHDRLRKNDK